MKCPYFSPAVCIFLFDRGVVLRVDLKDEQQARKFVEISNSLDTEVSTDRFLNIKVES